MAAAPSANQRLYSNQPYIMSKTSGAAIVAPLVASMLNRAGCVMAVGVDAGANTFYCGRILGILITYPMYFCLAH